MTDNRYVTYDAHMQVVNALLRLNKQMAAFDKMAKEQAANHTMILNEMRAMMATNDDMDRRMNAITTALARSDLLDVVEGIPLGSSRLLQLEDKSDSASLTDHIHKGTLKIDGLGPDKK